MHSFRNEVSRMSLYTYVVAKVDKDISTGIVCSNTIGVEPSCSTESTVMYASNIAFHFLTILELRATEDCECQRLAAVDLLGRGCRSAHVSVLSLI